MNKLISAYKNEMQKLLKKKLIIIMTLVMIVITSGSALLMFAVSKLDETVFVDYDREIEWMNTEKEQVVTELEEATDGITKAKLIDRLVYFEYNLKNYSFRKENKQYNQRTYYFAFSAFEEAMMHFNLIRIPELAKEYGVSDVDIKAVFDYYDFGSYEEEKAQYELFMKICDEKDFEGFIKAEIDLINSYDYLSDKQKELQISFLEFRLENGLTGESKLHEEAIDQQLTLSAITASLESGYDEYYGSGKILLPSDVEAYKDILAVANHKVNNDFYTKYKPSNIEFTADDIIRFSLSAGMTLILILMIILAGTSVASEVSSGAVKAVLVQPVKRWKIFTAKGVALLTVSLAECILITVAGVIATGAVCGFGSLQPYVYAAGGVAHSMPFAVFALLLSFVMFIRVFFLASLAFMISSCTKTTAIAIAIPLGVNYILDGIVSIIALFGESWLKYFPTVCISALEMKLLASPAGSMLDVTDILSDFGMGAPQVSVAFAAIYLAVLVAAMILTGRDSFCHRDIK